ncbi:LysR family transcriptional regulator [Saccharibacillus kuerlensis]|uniref:LysR family transcriptional regulator n=1 Tax=Saccharibacillus kuerlensis TaxID=459527 RepID=A0ABQ2L443_9BACL|nr:LysR family transcriptional regulator [Saccharibacillus kuerlensis]GGO02212.1 LysR family transcriptional regulator [Saccharibacillus kuerlensis]
MSVHAYTVLQTVIETGSFTRAAHKLSLSQPAVSHSIRSLEKELGVQLLNRGGKLELTEIGEELLPHIHTIVARQEHIQQLVDERHELKRGSIRLGSFPSVTSTVLPPLLRSFRQQYPGISVSIHDGGYGEIEQGLIAGAFDLVFLPYNNRKFDSRLFFEDAYVAVAPLDFPTREEGKLFIEELDARPFILPLDGCEQVFLPLFNEYGISPNIEYELKHSLSVIGMVAQGLGISIVPEGTASMVSNRVKVLPLTPRISRSLYAGISRGNESSPAVKEFLRFISVR